MCIEDRCRYYRKVVLLFNKDDLPVNVLPLKNIKG